MRFRDSAIVILVCVALLFSDVAIAADDMAPTPKLGTVTVLTGDVSGTVFGLDGRTVRSGVVVALKDEKGEKMVATAQTDKAGQYVLKAAPGRYQLMVDGTVKAMLDVTKDAKISKINIIAPAVADPYRAKQWEFLAGVEATSLLIGAGVAILVFAPIAYTVGRNNRKTRTKTVSPD